MSALACYRQVRAEAFRKQISRGVSKSEVVEFGSQCRLSISPICVYRFLLRA